MAAQRLLAEFKFNPDLLALVSLSNQNCNYVKLFLSKYEKKLFQDVQENKNVKEIEENNEKLENFEYDQDELNQVENVQVADQDNILETLI